MKHKYNSPEYIKFISNHECDGTIGKNNIAIERYEFKGASGWYINLISRDLLYEIEYCPHCGMLLDDKEE